MTIETTTTARPHEQRQGDISAVLDAIIDRLDDLELELLPCASPAEVMNLVKVAWEARRSTSEVDALTHEVIEREHGPLHIPAAA